MTDKAEQLHRKSEASNVEKIIDWGLYFVRPEIGSSGKRGIFIESHTPKNGGAEGFWVLYNLHTCIQRPALSLENISVYHKAV